MARLQWSKAEWMMVVANALPLMNRGMPRSAAVDKAQRLMLDKSRHRSIKAIGQSFAPSNGSWDRFHLAFHKLGPEAQARLVGKASGQAAPPAPPAPPAGTEEEASGWVRWTARERAIMAAAVEHLRGEPGNENPRMLAQLYIKAQRMVLPADRQRSPDGIKQSMNPKKGFILRQQHDAGLRDAWQFPETQSPFRAPPPAEALAPPPAPAAAAAAPPAPSPAPSEPAPAPEPFSWSASSAAVLFGTVVTQAMEQLLQARDAHVMHQLTQRLLQASDGLHERTGLMVQELLKVQVGVIAAEVASAMRAVLIAELGAPAPVASPAPPAAAAQAPAPAPAPLGNGAHTPGLRIDILGTMDAGWAQRIRQATSDADELRIFDFAQAKDYAPHRGRHLIVMQQGKLPRGLQAKLEASGTEPLFVRDAAGQVLRAVQDLKGVAHGAALQ